MTPGASTRRVLFVANDPPGRAVYRYRCENLADVLRTLGWQADVAWVGDRRVGVDHDVVVLHRICAVAEGRAYARAARACGAVLIYGTDDLVFDATAFPREDVSAATARLRRYAPLHAAMMEMADAVLVSTEALAAAARSSLGDQKPVFVVRNFLALQLCQLSDDARCAQLASEPKPRVTIAYLSGTPTHDADLSTIAEPLANALRAHPAADLLLVGPVEPPAELRDAAGDRLRRRKFVHWTALPTLLASVDINLAPLDLSRRLNHAKSEIKLLEAGAVGVPTIASACDGFREALTVDVRGGFLACDSADWSCRLSDLIEDAPARRAAGAAARDFVLAHGTADAHRPHIGDIFAEIAALPHHCSTTPRRASFVGSPADPKYLVKSALGRLRRGRT